MQYALVSSTCKTTHRNITLAVERDVKQQKNLNHSIISMHAIVVLVIIVLIANRHPEQSVIY